MLFNKFLKFRLTLYILFGLFCFFQEQYLDIESNQIAVGISFLLAIASHFILRKFPVRTSYILGIDCILLTAFIAASGASNSPLTIFYLLILVLCAIFENQKTTWFMYVFTLASYYLLFSFDCHADHHGHHSSHLKAMYYAYMVVGGLVTFYLTKLIKTHRAKEQELLEAQSKRYQLSLLTSSLADSAHKLGTPLATIQLALEDLKKDQQEKNQQSEEYQIMFKQIDRIKEIIFDLRKKAGQGISPEWENRDLLLFTKQLENNCTDLNTEWIINNVEGSYKLPFNIMENAVMALIDNARRISDTEPVIVEISKQDPYLSFIITDCSPGFPKEIIENLDQPFKEESLMSGGLGLGLYIANLVAESLGGQLQVQNESDRTKVILSIRYEQDSINLR